MLVRHFLIPFVGFLLGCILIASFYIGILTWAQGWDYASTQFVRDGWYVLPIIVGFGVQVALYTVLRFRLFIPLTSTGSAGSIAPITGVIGASGGTSATAMIACCLHHVTDVLPVLGLSAAATFLNLAKEAGLSHHHITRRDFIKGTTALISGLIGLSLGLPSIAFLLSSSLRKQEDNSSLDLGLIEDCPIGVPTRFEFTRTKVNGWERTAINYGLYVLRRSESEVRVFSDICTHLGCRVAWHPDLQHYVSPCHNGFFDILGVNISGPPPRPLDEFITKIENGNLFVNLPPIKRNSG